MCIVHTAHVININYYIAGKKKKNQNSNNNNLLWVG